MGIRQNLKNIIKNSPEFIQRPIVDIYGKVPSVFKYNKSYRKGYNEIFNILSLSQEWSKEKLEEYQMAQLINIINHSYKTVPYYKKTFDNHNINISQIQNFNDIKIIPYLTKEIIQSNLDDLVSNEYNKNNLQHITTGGSTGVPMGFYVNKEYEYGRENAFIDFLYSRVGYKNGDRTFILRGDIIDNVDESKNIFCEKDLFRNEMKGSSYHLKKDNIKYYINALNEYKPSCIKAYPSSLYLLSLCIKENNLPIDFKNIKIIILASENIYNYQRNIFKEIFPSAKVYSFYGHTEHACLAGECEINQYYHLQSEYGYSELINEKGLEAKDEDELGEIVATGFNNYVMPLIRYKTSDIAINTNESCTCERGYKLIKGIQGRKQEQIITEDGTKIALTSIIHSQHLSALGRIKAYQLIQDEKGKINIRIVKCNSFSQTDIDEIINKMESAANYKLKVSIELVDDIEKTSRGKCKFLIQNIKE